MQTILQNKKFFGGLILLLNVFITNTVFSISCPVPNRPGVITATGGNTKVCPGSVKVYSVGIVSGAFDYIWTPPVGGTITNGQGTRTVTITYTASFVASDSLRVVGKNTCGTGSSRALFITRNNPTPTGTFTGQVQGICGLTAVPYSVPNVAGITYNWSFDTTGATVVTGQGTNAITVDFATSFVVGILGVTANNACGASAEHHLHLKAAPPQPDSIVGITAVCANQQGVPYSITPVPYATSYNWNAPTGSHISDGVTTSLGNSLSTTATSVTVNYGSSTGFLKVAGVNTCAIGTPRSTAISIVCRGSAPSFANGLSVSCYPMPAKGELNVSFYSYDEQDNSISLKNIIGKTIFSSNNHSSKGENKFSYDVSMYPTGIYFLEVKNGDESKVQKIELR